MALGVNSVRKSLSLMLRTVSNWHRPSGLPNVFVFTTPRSGSTWLMELIQSQPGFKCCSEPLDLRVEGVSENLGLDSWEDLYQDESWPQVKAYFEGLCSGRIKFLNQSPFIPFYRPYTKRLVAKVSHGGEAQIERLSQSCGARVVFLLRHPIAVSLSRVETPRLEAFLRSDYRKNFSQEEQDFAWDIIRSGSDLQKGVLDWCLQNAVPLRNLEREWIVISYEELVLAPEPILSRLTTGLDLESPSRLYNGLSRPSETVRKSDQLTADVLNAPMEESKKWWLVGKWREKVDEDSERKAMRILEYFKIDLYRFGDILPHSPLWVGQELKAPPRSES